MPESEDASAPWITRAQQEEIRRERIREAAVAFARLLDADKREWADAFGEWCADRYGFNGGEFPGRMPSFKRAWDVYWKEPVDFGDGPDESEEDDD